MPTLPFLRRSSRHHATGTALGIASLALLLSVALAEPDKAAKPNIIFILFDDLGYGEPTSYRADSPFKTPNLDRLAKEGMRFTDAHSASSVCTPTRYGVLTGRYPWRIGQYGVLGTFSPPIIERERLTVGALMQQHGYHTACIGKWHLGMDWGALKDEKGPAPVGTAATDGPIARGFDYFFGYTHARNIEMLMEQDKVVAHVPDVEAAPRIARKTIAYIDERAKDGKPFFLYVPLSQPHTPHVPSPEFQGKSGQKAYGDWMMQGDDVVGQILAALDRNRIADNTLLLVTSDNGAAGHVYAPLRGCKMHIWEGGHRVPFYARWPGKIAAASTCDDTVCHNDLLATCADIVGAKLPDNAGEDSCSILPDLLGSAKGPARETTVHQSMRGDLAIRQGPWKLVFLTTGTKELYHLKDDLGEAKDLAAAHPEEVARLTQAMQRVIDNGRSTAGAPQKNAVVVRPGVAGKKAGSEPE